MPPAIPIAPVTAGTAILVTTLPLPFDDRPLRAADVLWLCVLPPPLPWLVEPVLCRRVLCRLVLRRFVLLWRLELLRRLAVERLALERFELARLELARLELARLLPPLWPPEGAFALWLRVRPRELCWRVPLLCRVPLLADLVPLFADLLDERPRPLERLEEPRPLVADIVHLLLFDSHA
jgi:hypothetical protein